MPEFSFPQPPLETLADLARRSGISYTALNYSALKAGVQPRQLAGDRRLYDALGIALILAAVASNRPRRKRFIFEGQ